MVRLDGNQEVRLLREVKLARENVEAEVAINNELKEENRKIDKKWLDAERKLGEAREYVDDLKTQVSHNKGKADEYLRRMDRADGIVKEQCAYIKSKKRIEEDKDNTISQQQEEIARLNDSARRGNEVVRSKEETIISNNRTI